MEELSILPEDIQEKMTRLQADMNSLQESFDDFTLTQDDLDAIEDGQRDYAAGRTRRL